MRNGIYGDIIVGNIPKIDMIICIVYRKWDFLNSRNKM